MISKDMLSLLTILEKIDLLKVNLEESDATKEINDLRSMVT